MKPRYFLVLLVLSSVLLGGSILQHRAVKKRQGELTAVLHQQTELDAQVREAEEQWALAQKNQSLLQGTLNKAVVPPSEEQKSILPGDFMDRVNDDPRVQVLMQSARRATLDATYGPFFRALQLTPEEIDVFKDLIVRRNQDEADLRASQNAQHLSSTDPAMSKLYQQLNKEYETAQLDLLGEAGFKAWQEYEKTSPARDLVSGIAGAGIVAGVPFSAETCEKLIHLVAASSPGYEKGQRVDLAAVDWEMVDAQAQILLSPEQYATFTCVEPPGPATAGARNLTRLNRMITQAAEAEKKEKAGPPHRPVRAN